MKENLLMSYEEYSKVKHEKPYFYIVKSKDQYLYYFGAKHSNDPKHSQFVLLTEKLNEFLNQTKDKKRIVLVEQNIFFKKMDSLDESILKYGESGAGAYFALNNGILIHCPDPAKEYVVGQTIQNFTKEEILCYYLSNVIKHWQKNKEKPNLAESLSEQNQRYRKLLEWPELDISPDYIINLYEKILKKDISLEDDSLFEQISTPVFINSRINEISRSQSDFRNKYILDQIEKYWNERYNIFIIYGASHAVMQEPAIRSLIS
ncbi:MAG: hypothetical protein Q8Q92_04985 [bacterium]|nr:hypothetical protein [bacterium]